MPAVTRNLPTPVDPETFAGLEPSLFLPEQFFPSPEPDWSGELSLLWTVFTDGVEAFRREVQRDNEKSELFQETVDWIHETGSDSIFSFESLCETFDLNPVWLRRWLFAWRDRVHATFTLTRKAA